MLRYDRQTKTGLVALYDIRPGNGAGPFLQPRTWAAPRILRWGYKIRERCERKIFFIPPTFPNVGYKQANISRGLLNILKFAVWLSH